ncbi:hypothetical protein C8J57DRAFT_1359761 [Mycena rebaudengoi]|nr:hypothetical protein C8J57DRAFT_1359761 [Mycena rebaudengoi]
MFPTVLLLAFVSAALAQNNDWTKPCDQGECFYDLPEADGVSGTMRIWGDVTAIADLTKASGWTIMDCDANTMAQDIRIVCTGEAEQCDTLFQGPTGATDTIVRLPQNCGQMPFARVARDWVHEDQSVPVEVARQLSRRQDAPPVLGVALDTNFEAVDPANGEVNVAVSGTTVPGQAGDLTVTPPPPTPRRRSRHAERRGLFSFIEDAFKKFNSFDKEVTKSLPPLDVDKNFPIFDQSIDCPPVQASIKASVDAKAHAVISLGMSAVGKIVPPSLSEFGVFVGLDADLSGTLNLAGSATGNIDSGLIDIFQVGIPGLDFPGILTIGPTFKIQAQATASLDVDVDMKVVLAYKVEGAKLFFPKSDSLTSGGNFGPNDSPLSLSVTPSVASKGTVAAHVIPRIDLGISGLAGLASATVFLNLDASAQMNLNLNAAVTASTDAATTKSVDGCIDIGAGFDVNAGASASFFGLFDPSTQVNLFSKKFELFKRCLGGAARRDLIDAPFTSRSDMGMGAFRRADLGCPAFITDLFKTVEEAVPAGSIKAL